MKIIKIAAAKDKIQKYNIEDPFLKVFIEKYEKIVPWGQIGTQDDLTQYIQNTLLVDLYSMIDRKSDKSNYLKDVNIKREFKRNMDNPIVQESYEAYRKDPEYAKKIMLDGFNKEKEEVFMSWWEYMFKGNDVYSKNPAFLYLMLKPIFDSSPSDRKNPPLSLNEMAVAEVYGKVQNSSGQINLLKSYQESLVDAQTAQIEETESNEKDGWVRIPSLKNDSANFEENVTKLKDLSKPRGWCTGNNMARPYLSEGDFWLYIHDGQARVAVRFVGDRIKEIQGDKNSRPFDYWQEIFEFVDKNGFDKENSHYKELMEAKELNDNLDRDPNYIEVFREEFMKNPLIFERLSNERQKQPEFLKLPLEYWENKIQEGPGEHSGIYTSESGGRLYNFNKAPEEIRNKMNNELIYLIYNDIEKDFDRDIVRAVKFIPSSHDFLEKLDMRKRVVGLVEREIQKKPWFASLIPPEFQMDLDQELMGKVRESTAYNLLVDLENGDSDQNPEEILTDYYDDKFDNLYEQDQEYLDTLKNEGNEDIQIPVELLDESLMYLINERFSDYWYTYVQVNPIERYNELDELMSDSRSSSRYDDWDDYGDMRELVESAYQDLVYEDPKNFNEVPMGFLDYMNDDGMNWYVNAWLDYVRKHPDEMFDANNYIDDKDDLVDYYKELFSKGRYPMLESYFSKNPEDLFDDENCTLIHSYSDFLEEHKEFVTNLAKSFFKDSKTVSLYIDTLSELAIQEIIPEEDFEYYDKLNTVEEIKSIEKKPYSYMDKSQTVRRHPEAIKAWHATPEIWVKIYNRLGEQLIEQKLIPDYLLQNKDFQFAREKTGIMNGIKGADVPEIYNFSKIIAPYKSDEDYYMDAYNWFRRRYTDLVLGEFMYDKEIKASKRVPDELKGDKEFIERLVQGIYFRIVNDLHKTQGQFHEIDPLIRDQLSDRLLGPMGNYKVIDMRSAFRLASMLSEIYPVYPEKFQHEYDRVKQIMMRILTSEYAQDRDIWRHEFLEKFPTIFKNDRDMVSLANQIAKETHHTEFLLSEPQSEIKPEPQPETEGEVMAHNWYKGRTIKLAQGVEFINIEDVLEIIESFGSRRFTIGFRKADRTLRMMNCQRKVQRPYEDVKPGGYSPNQSYMTLYDLQIASQIARENLADIDVNDFDASLLRQAYRRVYPHTVELIKGNGKTYVVRDSQYAVENSLEEIEEFEDENN